jgi:hypothetical protein
MTSATPGSPGGSTWEPLHPWSPSGPGTPVEVLLRIYARCLDGDDERWFGRLEDALGDGVTCPFAWLLVPGMFREPRRQAASDGIWLHMIEPNS